LKINNLEELTREGDLVKIFGGEYGRVGTARLTTKFAISNFAQRLTGFFSLYLKFSFLLQHKFVEVLDISEF